MILAPRYIPRLASTIGLFTNYGLRDFAKNQGLLSVQGAELATDGDASASEGQDTPGEWLRRELGRILSRSRIVKRLGEVALNGLTVVVGLSTVIMAVAVVRREWFTPRPATAATARTTLVKNWESIASGGRRMGPRRSSVTIVNFSDFQCPYCRQLALGQLRSLRVEFPNDVAVLYKDWHLPNHKYAYATARGGACAERQGKFEEFHDLVFAQQDSIPFKRIDRFAREAGVPDIAAFNRCAADTAPLAEITASVAQARLIGGRGTPTVVINGYLLALGADSVTIDSLVRAEIRRKRGS